MDKTLEQKITVADLYSAADDWYADPEPAKRVIREVYMMAVSDYLKARTFEVCKAGRSE